MQKSYTFDNPENYDFDGDFVEFSGGTAKLKIMHSEDLYSQGFASSTGFTYDSSKAEFSAGVLRQKDSRPALSTFGASYSSSIDGSWASSGSLTGTANEGASVSGGKLILSGGGNRSVDYGMSGRIGIQAGAIRLKWTPNYNGVPTDTQYFFTIAESDGSNNSKIQLGHHSNGSLFLIANDSSGTNVYSNSLFSFSATAGQESVIEVGWDLSGGGKFYVFGDGNLIGDLDGTFTRSDCAFLRVGASDNMTDSSIDDLILFSANQHTATHDPTYSVPDSAYVTSSAILPEMAYSAGGGTFLEATDLVVVDTNTPKYTIQVGRSGNYLYWNGSSWAISDGTFSQATDATTFHTNLATLDVGGEIYIQIKAHFSTSNLQQSIDNLILTINESTTYPETEQRITPQGRFEAATLVSFLDSVITPTDTVVQYILEVDSRKIYWSGNSWKSSDGTLAKSNTKQEVEDHIVEAVNQNSFVKLIVILKTDNSSFTPEITSAVIEFMEDLNGVRGHLNSVLEFIGSESMTDEEFETITLENIDDLMANYTALLGVLESREAVSSTIFRLQNYYLAQGVAVVATSQIPVSNIFVGCGLAD